ncbi:MAG TPA: pyridoxamine 5'-phosphate oxidase family protein [Pyrinomonadaceae bacterium]|jgi:general stress protein 26|nr:pyridoxamine 5'-phosphate oxidase family protein [Pyrinomonadaceae bacterium]
MTSFSARLKPVFLIVVAWLVFVTGIASGQEPAERERALAAARELVSESRYCALITQSGRGEVHARMMDPVTPEQDWTIWLATNPTSRKVTEIRRNPRVTLYYSDPASQGYVTIYGRAELVNDAQEKTRHWKDEWSAFYPNKIKDSLLIKFEPETMEVVIVNKNVVGTSSRWTPPKVRFKRKP